MASGDATMLTDGKSRNSEFVWSNKGDRIAYAGTLAITPTSTSTSSIPPRNRTRDKPLTENQGGGWQVHDWSPDDRTLLAQKDISINESYLWLVDVATGTKKQLTPKGGEKVAYQPIGFSRDGKGIYVTTDKGGEFQRIAYMDIATGALKYLNNDSWDVEDARALGGPRAAGLRGQRERSEHAACARSENRQTARRAEAANWADQRAALEREQSRPCLQPQLGAIAVGRVFGRCADRASSSAGPSARPAAYPRRTSSSRSW